jgi:two-component system, LytTR family, sensor histidine kinase AlgZ
LAEARDSEDRQAQIYLPDFRAPGTVLVVLLVAELIAITLTLTSYEPGSFLTELSKMSMYVLWLALLGTGLLSLIGPWAEKKGNTKAFVMCFIALELMCLVLAEVTWQTTIRFGEAVIINDTHDRFILRTFAASSIIIALSMRYLYVSSEWRRSIVLEAQARISALRALIRPHFLFNSMNTIASLTRSDPKQAEVAAMYQRIEKLRLGDRLKVRWNVAELPMRAQIPSLTIQPLLENAIYHGIELLPEGGQVVVTGKVVNDQIHIEMSNPIAKYEKRKTGGNKMALQNIRQRFELAYANSAKIDVTETDESYSVRIEFPYDETVR